jgi:MFS superfamily sulfate permease-like transporter
VWDKNFIDEMHPFFGLINELHSHLSEHIQSRLNPNEELIYDKKETRIIVYATSADKDEFGKRMKESIDKSTKRSDSILRLLDRGEKKTHRRKA